MRIDIITRMNVFQKISTVIIRFAGVAMIVVAVIGFIYVAWLTLLGKSGEVPMERIISSGIWLFIGVVLFISAPLIGRLIGLGLD
jgi:hypothetical protein